MHEKLFHFLSIKISAKLNDEYRKMPLILSLSHIVDEQQQNRQYKKKCGKDFRGVKKSLNTNLLFICLCNAQWRKLDSFSFPHPPAAAAAMKTKINFIRTMI